MTLSVFEPLPDIKIPVGIISLRTSLDRREKMLQAGVPAEWVANYFPASDLRAAQTSQLQDIVDEVALTSRYGNTISPAEIGCALSHKRFYREFLDTRLPMGLVFEDDISPCPSFLKTLSAIARKLQLIAQKGVPFICNIGLRPGYLRLHGLNPVFIILNRKFIKTSVFEVSNKDYEVWYANAYFISISAAKNILNVEPKISLLADDWSSRMDNQTLKALFVTAWPIATQNQFLESTISGGRSGNKSKTIDQEKSVIDTIRRSIRLRARVSKIVPSVYVL